MAMTGAEAQRRYRARKAGLLPPCKPRDPMSPGAEAGRRYRARKAGLLPPYKPTDPTAPKACKTCGVVKAAPDFRKMRGKPGANCLSCANTKMQEGRRIRRRENPEKYRAVGRAEATLRRERHPERERRKARECSTRRRQQDPGLKAREYRQEKQDHPARVKMRGRKNENNRRARKANAFVEDVNPQTVLERDRGICGICGTPVQAAFHIDHVLPLSRGGEHSYRNTQLAHPRCNLSKGARVAA